MGANFANVFCNPQMPRAAAQETFGFAPNHSPAAIFAFHCAAELPSPAKHRRIQYRDPFAERIFRRWKAPEKTCEKAGFFAGYGFPFLHRPH